MLKMFLVGLGTGYVVFTKSGNDLVKKYMDLSNSLAHKGMDAVNSLVPKGEDANDEEVSDNNNE